MFPLGMQVMFSHTPLHTTVTRNAWGNLRKSEKDALLRIVPLWQIGDALKRWQAVLSRLGNPVDSQQALLAQLWTALNDDEGAEHNATVGGKWEEPVTMLNMFGPSRGKVGIGCKDMRRLLPI
jgi:hypothetical protein